MIRSFAGVEANTTLRYVVALVVIIGVGAIGFGDIFAAFCLAFFGFLLVLELVYALVRQFFHTPHLTTNSFLLVVSFLGEI